MIKSTIYSIQELKKSYEQNAKYTTKHNTEPSRQNINTSLRTTFCFLLQRITYQYIPVHHTKYFDEHVKDICKQSLRRGNTAEKNMALQK